METNALRLNMSVLLRIMKETEVGGRPEQGREETGDRNARYLMCV